MTCVLIKMVNLNRDRHTERRWCEKTQKEHNEKTKNCSNGSISQWMPKMAG